MYQQQSIPVQLKFRTTSTPGSDIYPNITTFHLQRHPKIKPELLRYRKFTENPNLKTRKFRVFYSKALNPLSHRLKSFPALGKVIRDLKTPNKVSRILYESDSPQVSLHPHLFSTVRRFPLISTLDLGFHQYWDNMKLYRNLFKSFTAFKNLKNFKIELMICKIPAQQIKCLKELRVFRNLSVGFRINSHRYDYDLLTSNVGKLRQLRELNLEMNHLSIKTDRFLSNLGCAFSKLCSLKKIGLKFYCGDALKSSMITLFQSLQILQLLSDFAFHLVNFRITPNSELFAECFQYLDSCPIQKLNLGFFREFKDENLFDLSKTLKKFAQLKILCLSFRSGYPTDEGLVEFGSTLGYLNSFTYLNLELPFVTKVHHIVSALRPLQNLA